MGSDRRIMYRAKTSEKSGVFCEGNDVYFTIEIVFLRISKYNR